MTEEMSTGDMWRAHKAKAQAKRMSNREKSSALLTEAGIFFTTHNAGAHLVVADRFDFWPGTGLWSERGSRHPKREGRGVQKLINALKDETP